MERRISMALSIDTGIKKPLVLGKVQMAGGTLIEGDPSMRTDISMTP
jgi:hypothetical protein